MFWVPRITTKTRYPQLALELRVRPAPPTRHVTCNIYTSIIDAPLTQMADRQIYSISAQQIPRYSIIGLFVILLLHIMPVRFHIRRRNRLQYSGKQAGFTLIELMIGIAIGLLTIAVAMGALMVSRSISGNVTDSSNLQQQASYAFRVLGQQLRQAGSLRLNLAVNKTAAEPIDPSDPVAFETAVPDFIPKVDTLSGKDAPTTGEYSLTVGYRNYTEPTFPSGAAASLFRNCLGEQDSSKPNLIQSRFVLDSTNRTLNCAGSSAAQQALIENVADFQVRYLIQTGAATGAPVIEYANADTADDDWTRVFGVEICLVLHGSEVIDMPAGTSYLGCSSDPAVGPIDMSSTGTLPAARKSRMHMTFRSVYQLRSQGLIG